jgi:AraC-like DNA-binding protein/quercetin dioxygenase-like cupin family protein
LSDALKSNRNRQAAGKNSDDSYPDQSYLAYLRPTPRPFLRFTSGHFPAGTQTTPHSHPCLALHGCIQGPLSMITPGGEQFLDAGVFYLIAPGIRHHWRNSGRHTAATLGLLIDAQHPGRWPTDSGVEACCRLLQRRGASLHRFASASDPELHRSFWLAADHLTAEESRDSITITGTLLTLLGQVAERLQSARSSETKQMDTAQQIRRLLLARVADRLSIEEISREVCASPTRAKEAFRSAFGCGIMAYFNQLKIWQAKRLLSDPSLTVEQVSLRLGFANPGYFTRVFSNHTGETPTDFRRLVGAD